MKEREIKAMIKSGVLVQTRNGQIAICIGDILTFIENGKTTDGYMRLSSYRDDATEKGTEEGEWDIIKISNVLHPNERCDIQCWDKKTLNNYTIWEAPEPKVIEVKLNESYTAKITPDEIEVGCQKFSPVQLKEIYKAYKKISK